MGLVLNITFRIAAFVVAFLVALYAPSSIGLASEEMVTFASIVAAGALSALVLSATLFHQGSIDIGNSNLVKKFVSNQTSFWLTFFVMCAVSVIFIISGNMSNWADVFSISIPYFGMQIGSASIIAFFSLLSFMYLILFLVDFVNAILDLVRVSVSPNDSTRKASLKHSKIMNSSEEHETLR